MKVATRCLGCRKLVRKYGSLSVRLFDYSESPLTGELKAREQTGKICRKCAADAGYKIKEEHGVS